MSEEIQIINLLIADVLEFHEDMSATYTMEPGIHDMNMLESAVNAPFQSFSGQDLYPTVFDKAARLCYGLTKNHPFCDGNKRTAVHSMLIYLGLNNIFIDYDKDELEELIINVASGKISSKNLSEWLQDKQI